MLLFGVLQLSLFCGIGSRRWRALSSGREQV